MRSALFAGVACLAGCSLLVPLDAASGGDDPDAGGTADASDGGATSNDGGGGSDGNPGTTSDADSASLALKCPSTALVCDDFEKDLAQNGWGVYGVSASSSASYSPTQSLSLVGSTDYRRIEKIFDTMPKYLRISLRLHAGAPPPGFLEIVKIPFGPVNNWDTATLGLDGSGLVAGIQGYDNSSTPTGNAATVAEAAKIYGAGFHLIVMDLDFRDVKKIVSVSVDGAAPKSTELGAHITTLDPAVLMIGTLYANADGTISDTYVDDFVIEPK